MLTLRFGVAAATAALLWTSGSHASFVGFVVSSTTEELGGQRLSVYTLAARFDGAADTVSRAFDLTTTNSDWLVGFWHKDNHGDMATNGILSQDFGTWNPRRTGSNAANRRYDSYLTIGGIARSSNETRSDGTYYDSDEHNPRAWDRAALPADPTFNWYVEESSTGLMSDEISQGRVGNSPGLPTTDVRLGQFVLSEGHDARTFGLSIQYRSGYSLSGDEGYGYQVASGSFTLGVPVPTPGSLALIFAGLLTARSRRR